MRLIDGAQTFCDNMRRPCFPRPRRSSTHSNASSRTNSQRPSEHNETTHKCLSCSIITYRSRLHHQDTTSCLGRWETPAMDTPNRHRQRPQSNGSITSQSPSRSPSVMSSATSSTRSHEGSSPKHRGDVAQWQFWPQTVTVGSTTNGVLPAVPPGSHSTGADLQLYHAQCRMGPEERDPKNPKGRVQPHSFVSFDFQRELLVFKCSPKTDRLNEEHKLPPVLLPLDCELPWSDIASHGIDIEEVKNGGMRQSVVVTATCRRPPRYFVPFEEPTDRLYRRRATEMDFNVSGKVGYSMLASDTRQRRTPVSSSRFQRGILQM